MPPVPTFSCRKYLPIKSCSRTERSASLALMMNSRAIRPPVQPLMKSSDARSRMDGSRSVTMGSTGSRGTIRKWYINRNSSAASAPAPTEMRGLQRAADSAMSAPQMTYASLDTPMIGLSWMVATTRMGTGTEISMKTFTHGMAGWNQPRSSRCTSTNSYAAMVRMMAV